MNYVSAVYGVVGVVITVDWFTRGRKHYRGQAARHEAAASKVGDQEAVTVVHRVGKLE